MAVKSMFLRLMLHHSYQIVCSSWPEDFTIFEIKSTVGMSYLPVAHDDPRHTGFPCFSKHVSSKARQNKFATWTVCLRCAMRLSYHPKGSADGHSRQMGPHPHLVRMAMQTLEADMAAEMVTEQVVQGKLMELKGLALQRGLTSTMAVNMTYAQYQRRMEMENPMPKTMEKPTKNTEKEPKEMGGYPPATAKAKCAPAAPHSRQETVDLIEEEEIQDGEWMKMDGSVKKQKEGSKELEKKEDQQ